MEKKQLRKAKTAPLSKSKQASLCTVVVPVYLDGANEWSVRIALDLVRTRQRQGRVILKGMVRVPQGNSLSEGATAARETRALLEQLHDQFRGEPLAIPRRIQVTHEPWRTLIHLVRAEEAEWAVIPWLQQEKDPLFAIGIDRLLSRLPCNVIVLKDAPTTSIHRILLPLRGSTEAARIWEVALSLAQTAQAKVTILHATQADEAPVSGRVYAELMRMNQGNPWIAEEVQAAENVIPAILAQASAHDLIVMGVTGAEPGNRARAIGPVARHLRHSAGTPLVIVKSHQPTPLDDLDDWEEEAQLPATPTSVVVDKWFAENTFSSEEFGDIERLVALKEAQGLTISLGLPTLNEEESVGKVIQVIQKALVERLPLLDEIVLIDSGSTDRTAEIARGLGIPVHQHSEILPEHGSYRGKGEALWKSLHLLRGDLVAWIDTDIANIHPRFVYGILGPLLRHPGIQYVKGFYRRPLRVGDRLQAGGGGRVTELVARPLINLFYPELSGVVQPLSGEYAGRREALEQLPFYTGYGVEIGLLLSLVERYGISGIAQVDLLSRVHHNQPLGALSRMAFAIHQVFVDHLEQRQRVQLLNELNRTMKIINYEPGRFSLVEQVISDRQRPPLITLPEYRAQRERVNP